jgi:hypothetical protein
MPFSGLVPKHDTSKVMFNCQRKDKTPDIRDQGFIKLYHCL